jgi:hypothetical protein
MHRAGGCWSPVGDEVGSLSSPVAATDRGGRDGAQREGRHRGDRQDGKGPAASPALRSAMHDLAAMQATSPGSASTTRRRHSGPADALGHPNQRAGATVVSLDLELVHDRTHQWDAIAPGTPGVRAATQEGAFVLHLHLDPAVANPPPQVDIGSAGVTDHVRAGLDHCHEKVVGFLLVQARLRGSAADERADIAERGELRGERA